MTRIELERVCVQVNLAGAKLQESVEGEQTGVQWKEDHVSKEMNALILLIVNIHT